MRISLSIQLSKRVVKLQKLLNKIWIGIKKGWAEYRSASHHQSLIHSESEPMSQFLEELNRQDYSGGITASKSTQKLKIVSETVNLVLTNVTLDKLDKLKSLEITWQELGAGETVVCPNLKIEFSE